jgi:hypothetical protein
MAPTKRTLDKNVSNSKRCKKEERDEEKKILPVVVVVVKAEEHVSDNDTEDDVSDAPTDDLSDDERVYDSDTGDRTVLIDGAEIKTCHHGVVYDIGEPCWECELFTPIARRHVKRAEVAHLLKSSRVCVVADGEWTDLLDEADNIQDFAQNLWKCKSTLARIRAYTWLSKTNNFPSLHIRTDGFTDD